MSFTKVSELYACDVFHLSKMKEYLTQDTFDALSNTIENGETISTWIADSVATAMKSWAIEKQATHYTHWFQPLTGATAEKHDAFFTPLEQGKAIERFDGRQLIQQEPDASSFPNGGIRNTFEARGYTAWDPSSPAFIYDGTLCIPTIFISYTGEALDYKTPLLKSIAILDKAAVGVCNYFDTITNKVIATLGWEQEFFVIDANKYKQRPDLQVCKRTLFGRSAEKGQVLEDHYFGSIPMRVKVFMKELETAAWKLGIPVKTRHNEVAPNQFEIAPVFEEVNIAIDHNQLLMDIMQQIADKHNLKVLLHEKPFTGVNGSGKHNNWSLATNTGKNLLSPGKTPQNNLQFLTFFVNVIKAVHTYADVLRASIASAGNDHRLGANEAPPAIVSVFIGSYLTKVLETIELQIKDRKMNADTIKAIELNISKIPAIILDNTDRNRTSPFAFTGNKFEFRAVGSSANCASAMITLNSMMAKQLLAFQEEVNTYIKKKKLSTEEAIFKVLKTYIASSKSILFEGNGYGDEWVVEAEKRGLSNFKNTIEALTHSQEITKELFTSLQIFSDREVDARYEIAVENFCNTIEIEAKMLIEIVYNQIIPATVYYQKDLAKSILRTETILGKDIKTPLRNILEIIVQQQNNLQQQIIVLQNILDKPHTNLEKTAKEYATTVRDHFVLLRDAIDTLELYIPAALWKYPKYRDLLDLSQPN